MHIFITDSCYKPIKLVGYIVDLHVATKKVDVPWNTIFCIFLIVFIIFGFGTKLILSVNMSLNSDMVGEGIEAMEIGSHQNYFLSGYYLPSQDTFIFTELLPFQLLPQILTGYDPLALKLVIFMEFALGVGILSYIVYMISGSTISALQFAALAANLPTTGYYYFALPTSHMGTTIFLGVIFALLIYMAKKEDEQKHRNRKGKIIRPSKIRWPYILGLMILVALTVISDSIILPWLIIPYIIIYLLLFKEKTRTLNIAVASMAIVSVIAYLFKTYFIFNWVVQDVFAPRTATDMLSAFILYVKDLILLLNQGLYGISVGFGGFGIPEAISLLAFVAIVVYAVKNALEDRKKWFYYGILLASALTVFAMWLVSNYSMDSSSARYLTFTAFAIFMLIAMSYRDSDKVYCAIAIVLLLTSAFYGITQLGGHSQPNADEYGLISFLKENNLTFGYSGYWTSNIITYLSGEDVTVRKVVFYRDDMQPWMWHSCERWYQSTPDRSFILIDNSSIDDNGREVIKALTTKLNASPGLHYGKYDIYPLQGYHIGPFQVYRP